MAKKKTDEPKVYKEHPSVDQRITDTLRENYMPYAMSVIVSRAIPEIDGFKPSHRKLLYTMYKMGLLNGNRTKSANIVGQTMKLNPHGDAAIYETMVRLTRGNEALLMPFVDSKGNFGKVYSRDMAYAAPRYTEAKLDAFCAELFRDIDTDAVDFVDNYDGEMKEPTLLPTTYPNILVSANTGIAVGMASNFCGFNLAEVCRTTIELIKNPEHDILSTLPAPDFTTGGDLIYDEAEMRAIYRTGRGSFKVRAKWAYNKKDNLIEIDGDSVHDHHRGHHRQDRRAGQERQGARDCRCARRDRPFRSEDRHRPQARHRPGKADGQADEDDYPAGQLLLQFQRADCRHAARARRSRAAR